MKAEIERIQEAYHQRHSEIRKHFHRSVSFGDVFTDRWERARDEGFGEGTSVYDNVLIIGDVKIGKHVWIGPNCILDGSGGLEIGDHCSISAGVQIYTHHTVRKAVSMGNENIDRAPTYIGDGVYIGPNSIIQMGIIIGDRVIIGAMSFVNKNIMNDEKVAGCPAKSI